MLIRLISGACYTAVITGFFFLRGIDSWLFQILNAFFCTLGTFEIARAVKPFSMKGFDFIATFYGILFVLQYSLFQYVFLKGYGYVFAIALSLLFVLITVIVYFVSGKKLSKERTGKNKGFSTLVASVMPFMYPSLLVLGMCLCNDIEGDLGKSALLLVFVLPAISDTMAYLVGMIYNKIRKGNAKKLCPRLSPKKTIAGAIGGIIGGTFGAFLIYWIVKPVTSVSPVLFFMIVGVFASVLTEIGDLAESFVKRRVGIKDMGKIMPGHGGIMDRIDGTSLASVFLFFMFKFVA